MISNDIFPKGLFPDISAASELTDWFRSNARQLPWRADRDPYRIWVSEIMLQQTTIGAVKGYFDRFTNKLPDMKSLAACPEDELMKLWEGLGYYSRVRNMQKSAKFLVEEGYDNLPDNYKDLLRLPGIGPYTAGAIASIAYDQPYPAVDGNVLRVLMRLNDLSADITRIEVRKKTEALLTRFLEEHDEIRPSLFNEGIMELGEVICLPHGQPCCVRCPLSSYCEGFHNGRAAELPVRSLRSERKIEDITVFILICQGRTAVRKRSSRGLLSGLYEFPNKEGHLTESEVHDYLVSKGAIIKSIERWPDAKHLFTHREWHMRAYRIELEKCLLGSDEELIFAGLEELLENYAVPGAFEKYKRMLT